MVLGWDPWFSTGSMHEEDNMGLQSSITVLIIRLWQQFGCYYFSWVFYPKLWSDHWLECREFGNLLCKNQLLIGSKKPPGYCIASPQHQSLNGLNKSLWIHSYVKVCVVVAEEVANAQQRWKVLQYGQLKEPSMFMFSAEKLFLAIPLGFTAANAIATQTKDAKHVYIFKIALAHFSSHVIRHDDSSQVLNFRYHFWAHEPSRLFDHKRYSLRSICT